MRIGDKIEFTFGTMRSEGKLKSFMTERFSEDGITFDMFKIKREGYDDVIINESQILKINGVDFWNGKLRPKEK